MKIVSLLPSATEVLYALGQGDSIVGISHDCDYPPEVRSKPFVSRVTLAHGLSSAEIDAAVGAAYHAGGSIYHLDPAFLERERPDLIIAQELCQVCAVTSAEARHAAKIAKSGARILSVEPHTLAEIVTSFKTLGEAAEAPTAAVALAKELTDTLADLRTRLAGITRPRVVCLGWLAPLILEGHWLPEMVEAAGGEPGLVQAGAHARRIDWAELRAYKPDVLVLIPCSFDLQRTISEAVVLSQLPGWSDLQAVQSKRVYAFDSGWFSVPGPRLATGLKVLARCLHPERFGGATPKGVAAQLSGPAAFSPLS